MKKKVCFITSSKAIGGTELATMRLSRIFVEGGHDVIMIAPGTMMKDELDKYHISFLPVSISGRIPLRILMGALRLAKVLKREKFDIIHCQDASSLLVTYYARKFARVSLPIIWHERYIHWYSYWLMSKLSFMPDLVVTNSYFERNKLIDPGFNPAKILVIYNGFEIPEITEDKKSIRNDLGIPQDHFLIGCVGRLSRGKGVQYLLQAFKEVQKQRKDTHLLYVGDGEEREMMEKYISEYSLQKKVTITGFRRDTVNLYSIMDVMAFPTLTEAFGNVAVEAMLTHTPVLASYVGGIPEIITDNLTGLFAPVAIKEKWVEKLVFLYDHPDVRKDITERAYDMAIRRFSHNRMYIELDAVYDELIASKKK